MAVRIEKGGWALIFLAGAALVSYSLHRYRLVDLRAVFGEPGEIRKAAPAAPAGEPLDPLPTRVSAASNELRVGVSGRVSCAGGLVANGGLETQSGSIFHDKGLRVSFSIIDDWTEAAAAFAGDTVDMMLTTVDVWARDYARLREKNTGGRAFFMTAWSRGADGIIAREGTDSIEDLAGKIVAFAPNTPSHFLLWSGLRGSGLSTQQRTEIFNKAVQTKDGIQPALLFSQQKIDVAVAWDPDMSDALAKRPGAKKIYDTRTANRLIADILVVSDDYARRNPKTIIDFIDGWLEGVEFIKQSPSRAYNLIGATRDFNIPADTAKAMLEGVRLSDFADNRQFFGSPGRESDYANIFRMAEEMYRELRLIHRSYDPESTVDFRFLDNLSDRGKFPTASTEPQLRYHAPAANAAPLMTQHRSIWFEPNSAMTALDSRLVMDDIGAFLRAYENTVVEIEANTDSNGSRDLNLRLSKERADAVRNYLIGKYGFPEERIRTAGNGPDRPLASNSTPEGREKNRRTDIKVYANPEG